MTGTTPKEAAPAIQPVMIVSYVPTAIWVESGLMGERAVMLQHEGQEPFEYAVFNYDYAYTSNGGTLAAAESLAMALGATMPIEHRHRSFSIPTADELRESIRLMTDELTRLEAEPTDAPERAGQINQTGEQG